MILRATVVVPVFQDQEGVVSCLEALARQSLPQEHFEIVVVDNGSVPEIEIPQGIISNVSLATCGTPGSYAARNKGAAVAQGRYLAFTDADCVPDTNWLKNGIRALEQENREIIVGGHVEFTPPPRHTMFSLYQMAVGFQQEENILRKGFSATANLFCRRETFQRVGPFAELEWVHWFNHHRLLEPIGNIPPAEAEENHYKQFSELPMAA